ncbi:hypothetical protein AGIG_G24327 [Arapaima gigas]
MSSSVCSAFGSSIKLRCGDLKVDEVTRSLEDSRLSMNSTPCKMWTQTPESRTGYRSPFRRPSCTGPVVQPWRRSEVDSLPSFQRACRTQQGCSSGSRGDAVC